MTPKQEHATIIGGSICIGVIIGECATLWRANRHIKKIHEQHIKKMNERIDKYNTLVDHANLVSDTYNRTVDIIREAAEDASMMDHDKVMHIVDMALAENRFYNVASRVF